MSWPRAVLIAACGLSSCCTAEPHQVPAARVPSELEDVSRGSVSEPNGSRINFSSTWSWVNILRGDEYALDDIPRRLEPKARLKCDPSTLDTYKGTSVVFSGGVLVNAAFIDRLVQFEALVNEVALEVYGRTPNRLLHAGAYSCRTSRNRTTRLSEHALGNALDVVGFSFNGVAKAQRATTPAIVKNGFRVTVGRHWNAERTDAGRLHRTFLRRLADETVAREIFRIALGPSHPGHADHLHFDMSPWNYTHL
jgi:hypothetical protein